MGDLAHRVGLRIRSFRRMRGLSVEQLAARIEKSKATVYKYESGQIPVGLSAADKVVGRATAYLYVLLKVKEVYAQIISQPAVDALREHGIDVTYDKLVPNIINRKGDGICPFEETVMPINDPQKAHAAILQKMQQLNITL